MRWRPSSTSQVEDVRGGGLGGIRMGGLGGGGIPITIRTRPLSPPPIGIVIVVMQFLGGGTTDSSLQGSGGGAIASLNPGDNQLQFINAVTTLAEGNLVPVPGGVLVRAPAADGEGGGIIGAVGVSGHQPDRDEECAVRGIEAAALTADPGA